METNSKLLLFYTAGVPQSKSFKKFSGQVLWWACFKCHLTYTLEQYDCPANNPPCNQDKLTHSICDTKKRMNYTVTYILSVLKF